MSRCLQIERCRLSRSHRCRETHDLDVSAARDREAWRELQALTFRWAVSSAIDARLAPLWTFALRGEEVYWRTVLLLQVVRILTCRRSSVRCISKLSNCEHQDRPLVSGVPLAASGQFQAPGTGYSALAKTACHRKHQLRGLDLW